MVLLLNWSLQPFSEDYKLGSNAYCAPSFYISVAELTISIKNGCGVAGLTV